LRAVGQDGERKGYTQANGERTLARLIAREMQALVLSIVDGGARRRVA
jgi:hypothetical protein